MKKTNLLLTSVLLALASLNAHAKPIPATEDGGLGLYRAADFRLADGACSDCNTLPQALWYFKGEPLATPTSPTDFSRTEQAQADVAAWMAGKPDLAAQPPLIWLGSGQVIAEATLSADGKQLTEKDGSTTGFAITPKIPSNLSYWNDDTRKFFTQRPVRLRGEVQGDTFTARTVWPLDYKIAPEGKTAPLSQGESLQSLVQFEHGGAQSAYQSRLLWEQPWRRKAGIRPGSGRPHAQRRAGR